MKSTIYYIGVLMILLCLLARQAVGDPTTPIENALAEDTPTAHATATHQEQTKQPKAPQTFTIQGPKKPKTLVPLPRSTQPSVKKSTSPASPSPMNKPLAESLVDEQGKHKQALIALLATIKNKRTLVPEILNQASTQWQRAWYNRLIVEGQYKDFVWDAVALGMSEHTETRLRNKQFALDALNQSITDLYLYRARRVEANKHYRQLLNAVQTAQQALDNNQAVNLAYQRLQNAYQRFSTKQKIASPFAHQQPEPLLDDTQELVALMNKQGTQSAQQKHHKARLIAKQIATFEARGDDKNALAWSHRLLTLENSYDNNARLARLYEQQDNIPAALYYLKRLHTMRPTQSVNKRLLTLYLRMGHFTQADDVAQALALRHAKDADVRSAQAQIYAHRQQWHKADDMYKSLLDERALTPTMQTNWALQYANQAQEQLALGLVAQARSLIRQSIALMPTADAYVQSARIEQAYGNSDAALDALMVAYQIEPQKHQATLYAHLAVYVNALASHSSTAQLTNAKQRFVTQLVRLPEQNAQSVQDVVHLYKQKRINNTNARLIANLYLKKAQTLQAANTKAAIVYAQAAKTLAPQSTDALRLLIALRRKKGNFMDSVRLTSELLAKHILTKTAQVTYARHILQEANAIVNQHQHTPMTSARKKQLLAAILTALNHLPDGDSRDAEDMLMRTYTLLPINQQDVNALGRLVADVDKKRTTQIGAKMLIRVAQNRFLAGEKAQVYTLMNRATTLQNTVVNDALVLLALFVEANQQQSAANALFDVHTNNTSTQQDRNFALAALKHAKDYFTRANQPTFADKAHLLAEQLLPVDKQDAQLRQFATQLTHTSQYPGAVWALDLLPVDTQDPALRVQALLGAGRHEQAYLFVQQADDLAPAVRAEVLLTQSTDTQATTAATALINQAYDLVPQAQFISLVDKVRPLAFPAHTDATLFTHWLGLVAEVTSDTAAVDAYKQQLLKTLATNQYQQLNWSTMPDSIKRDKAFMQSAVSQALSHEHYQVAAQIVSQMRPQTLTSAQQQTYAVHNKQIAQYLLKQDKRQQALSLLLQATQIAPDVESFLRIGDIQYLQGDMIASYMSWRKATQLDPNDTVARERAQRLAFVEILLTYENDVAKTIATLEEQAQSTPNTEERKRFLSQLYEQLGQQASKRNDRTAAKEAYKKALSYNARVPILNSLAQIAQKEQFWNEVIYYNMQIARRLSPQDEYYQSIQRALFTAYQQHATQLYELKRLTNATMLLHKALEVAQANAQMHFDTQAIHAQLSDYYNQLGKQRQADFHAGQAKRS